MKCKNCSALQWHPNKGFYCTVPDCTPNNDIEDVKEIYDYVMGDSHKEYCEVEE